MNESWGTASVTIPPDDDGMVGCQCPQDACRPRYFKIAPSSPGAMASHATPADGEVATEAHTTPSLETGDASPSVNVSDSNTSPARDRNQDEHESMPEDGALGEEGGETDADGHANALHCPYCGHVADRQQFFTPEQREYAKSLILRNVMGMLHEQLKRLERRPDPHALFSIGVTVKTGSLPDLVTYEERHLKQEVVCPRCQANYAVYGISFMCPRCGEGTILWHLDNAAREIRVFLEMPDDILARLDVRSQEKLIENALEDVVSFWEGYLKALYRHAIRGRYDPAKVAQLEQKIGTTFQRLQGATERYANDLGIDLLLDTSPEDVDLLTRVFNKRHALTHNLGLVDEKFLAQTRMAQQVGQEIEVTREETLRALDIVSKVLRRADEQMRAKSEGGMEGESSA